MKRALLYLMLLSVCIGSLLAKSSLPMPRHYVEDYTSIISSSQEAQLNQLLSQLEQQTGVQFIVLTINSTEGIPIEQYSIELAEQWKLGQKGKDNGFLLTVALHDRKYRFEVGYGLEGFLTDQYCGRIGRDVLVPAMKRGKYSEGIYQATLAIVNKIATHYNVQLSGIPSGYSGHVRRNRGTPCCFSVFPLLLFAFVFLSITGRGSVLWPLWFLMGMGYGGNRNPFNYRHRDYWGYSGRSGFGGFGRGGFGGGFSGGGGGGFGGGGASGGW